MSGKNQHVVPHANGWAVQGAGNSRATAVHSTQAEATAHARSIARNQQSELLIHGRNGQIRERDSYGNDPIHQRADPPGPRSFRTRSFL